MIDLQQVTFVRDGRTILDHVDLGTKPGEQWVILGRNGSGKTTILELINGYQFPSSGTVTVLGEKYGTVDVREMRKRIGYISQALFEKLALRDPVWEVVATGQYAYLHFYERILPEVEEKALGLLEQMGLAHVKDQALGTLSQGERKKIMLARSLMPDPELLILDEPCSGLDLFERERFLNEIRKLANVQMVYVTHHIEEIIPVFSHVALLEQGRLIAKGTKEEVLTPDNLLRVFDTRVQVDWDYGRPWVKVAHNG